jgi:chemotaxis protein MotA
MDIGTLIGLIATVVVIIVAILSASELQYFIDIPSIAVVFGSTFGVTFIKYRLSEMIKAFIVAAQAAFFEQSMSATEIIEKATDLTKIVQKDGIIALEGQDIPNEFMKKGIDLVMDGHSPEFTEKILRNIMTRAIEDSEQGGKMFSSMGESAPAMGMIGTLIGLVAMLQNLSDPAAIGPSMAVALITTLYGAAIAQIFCIPFAEKLNMRAKELKDHLDLIIESVLAIQQGQSALVMTQLLNTYLKNPEEGEK